MARVAYINVPDELKVLQRKAHQNRDRYILGVLQGQRRLTPKNQQRALKRKYVINNNKQKRGSLFKFLAPYWHSLTSAQKSAWTDASAYSYLSNWQLFISDNASRIKNDIPFPAVPSNEWQVRAGNIVINSPAENILLRQDHPQAYVVLQKIPGTPWKKEKIEVTEIFSLPLTLAISYKSNLVSVGTEQRARFYADILSSYQGIDIHTALSLEFSPSSDWTDLTKTLDSLRGTIIGYTLYLDIYGYTGNLLFDNIRSIHGGTNWARDPRCDDVSKKFKKAFAIVPPFWVPESVPNGASFSTVFPPNL